MNLRLEVVLAKMVQTGTYYPSLNLIGNIDLEKANMIFRMLKDPDTCSPGHIASVIGKAAVTPAAATPWTPMPGRYDRVVPLNEEERELIGAIKEPGPENDLGTDIIA